MFDRFHDGLFVRVKAVGVQGFHIAVFIDGIKMGVGHPDFFSLINVGSALKHVQSRGQHGGRLAPVDGFVSEPGHDAGLIVVAPEEGVPSPAFVHPLLPFGHHLFQFPQVEGAFYPLLAVGIIHLHVMEAEDHIEFLPIRPGVFHPVFDGGGGHFPYGDQIGALQHFPVHFLKEFVDPRSVGVKLATVVHRSLSDGIRKALILGDQIDDIQAESRDAHIGPKLHDFVNLPPHLFVFPIQIRLGFVEQMQVILLGHLVVFPGGTPELGLPVVGLIPPDVIGAVRVVRGFAGLLKPFVIRGCVVEHHVHDDSDLAPARFLEQRFELLHRSVAGVDGVIIAYVIAVVPLRRGIDRRDPDVIDAQIGEVVQFFDYPCEISSGGVFGAVKAFGVDLIDDGFSPVFVSEVFHGIRLLAVMSRRGEKKGEGLVSADRFRETGPVSLEIRPGIFGPFSC